MKPPKLLAKIAVLSFFVLFLAGFVAYRSGAFDKWFSKESSATQPAETNALMAAQDNTLATVDSPPTTKTIMSGSKSMPLPEKKTVYDRSDSTVSIPKEVIDKMIMMSGSKSGYLIPAERDTLAVSKERVDKIAESNKPSPSKPRTDSQAKKVVMPGSKSGVFLPRK